MCHTERLTVRPDTTCVGQARRWAAGHLHCWKLPENTVDAAVLMLSEAVTNAIVHARTDSTVSLVLTGRHLDVTGTDLNLSFPPCRRPPSHCGRHQGGRTRISLHSGLAWKTPREVARRPPEHASRDETSR